MPIRSNAGRMNQMPNKRKYNLSEAAIQQRRTASAAARQKRVAAYTDLCREQERVELRRHEPYMDSICFQTTSGSIVPVSPPREFTDIYAPLPKDAPNSEHQSRAALIRMHKLRNGQISGSARGGRPRIARNCPRCGVSCDTARGALTHCPSRKKIVENNS